MKIIPLHPEHQAVYTQLAHAFYHSDAVSHPIPQKNIQAAFQAAVDVNNPMAEGYLFFDGTEPVGFAFLTKTFSQEAGGVTLWLEDFYIQPAHRSSGIGTKFLHWLTNRLHKDVVRIRLEIMPDNIKAKALYVRHGFTTLPYAQMLMEREDCLES